MRTKHRGMALATAGCVGVFLTGSSPAWADPTPIIGRDVRISVTAEQALNGLGISLGWDDVPPDGVGRRVMRVTDGVLTDQGRITLVLEADQGFHLSSQTGEIKFDRFVIDGLGQDEPGLAARVVERIPGSPDVIFSALHIIDLTYCSQPQIFGSCINTDGSAQLDGYGLRLTGNAGEVIGVALGIGTASLPGTQFGIANIAVQLVPEPTTALLFGVGLAGLARRRSVSSRSRTP